MIDVTSSEATSLATNEKIKVDDPTLSFSLRDVREMKPTVRHPSAGCRDDVERMTPMTTRFGPDSPLRNGPKMSRQSSRKRGHFRPFCKFARRFWKTGWNPRLSQVVRGSEIRPSEKKDLFFTEGFHPPDEALEPPNNRCDKSPRFVDRLGPPRDNISCRKSLLLDSVRTRCARYILFYLLCDCVTLRYWVATAAKYNMSPPASDDKI